MLKYKAIVKTIEVVNDEIQNLDKIGEQVSESCKSVVDIVANLSAAAEENAATTEQTSASAEYIHESIAEVNAIGKQVSELAANMKDIMSRFKL